VFHRSLVACSMREGHRLGQGKPVSLSLSGRMAEWLMGLPCGLPCGGYPVTSVRLDSVWGNEARGRAMAVIG
jgi:hypothetical protein